MLLGALGLISVSHGAGATITPVSAVYVNQFYEVREHGAASKFVWNGETRIARSVAPLTTNLQLQRLSVRAGWSLRSVAVTVPDALAQFATARPTGSVVGVYRWNASTSEFTGVGPGETLPAGTVIWVRAVTNALIRISGAYAAPTNIMLHAGGNFVPSAGTELWTLSNAFPASASVWKHIPGAPAWEPRLASPLGADDQRNVTVGPGEALFVNLAAAQQLPVPDPALRLLIYHEDHLGSVSCLSDAQARQLREAAYYPYGIERSTAQDLPPRQNYHFAGKEKDAEHGMLNFQARLLWPVVGRFIRADSLADKFKEDGLGAPQSLNTYDYCRNNPLRLIDPDGREARVILHGDNRITIQVAIQYVGPLATKRNVAIANRNIEKYWTGKFGRYHVKMEVIDGNKDPHLAPATITLTAKDEKKKFLRSFVNVESDTGQWNPKDSDFGWTAAHETGHLMGLDDRYKDNKWGGSTPSKGWAGNMMATSGGRVQERNIKELVSDSGFMKLAYPGDPVEHHRKVIDKSPAAMKANQEALERDLALQRNAWDLSDK